MLYANSLQTGCSLKSCINKYANAYYYLLCIFIYACTMRKGASHVVHIFFYFLILEWSEELNF